MIVWFYVCQLILAGLMMLSLPLRVWEVLSGWEQLLIFISSLNPLAAVFVAYWVSVDEQKIEDALLRTWKLEREIAKFAEKTR